MSRPNFLTPSTAPVAAAVAVVAGAAVALRWAPAGLTTAAVQLDQYRCMEYRAPADQLVYESPDAEDGVASAAPRAHVHRYWARFSGPLVDPSVVFLHGRTSPSGNRRLVCVQVIEGVAWTAGCTFYVLGWSPSVLVPDALHGPAKISRAVQFLRARRGTRASEGGERRGTRSLLQLAQPGRYKVWRENAPGPDGGTSFRRAMPAVGIRAGGVR